MRNLMPFVLVEHTYHQVDDDRSDHQQEAQVQKAVYPRHISNPGHYVVHHDLISDSGQNPDERYADPIAQRCPVHPEHREGEQYDHDKRKDD